MKSRLKIASLCGAALLMFAACGSFSFAQSTTKPANWPATLLKWPYLIYPGVTTQMEVLWQDTDTETTNVLSWGTDTTYSSGQATVLEVPATTGETTAHQHIYTITGLQENTQYYYKVADATNGTYGAGSFITAPDANATSIRFTMQGDSRSQPYMLDSLDQAISKFTAQPGYSDYSRISIANGDWVSTDGESYWTNEWFVPGMTYLVNYTENTPINGVKGNHDNSSGYSATLPKYMPFPYPTAAGAKAPRTGSTTKDSSGNPYYSNLFWSFDYGPIHFTFIDEYSTMTAGSTQYNWVQQDLAGTTKPWKIVVYHEPAYSAGSDADNTGVRVFESMFTTYGVDMIFCGHSHNYARTGAYNSAQANGDLIALNLPHITSGGGGAPIYQPTMNQGGGYPHVIVGWPSLEFLSVDVEGNTLTYTAYQVNGGNTGAPSSISPTAPFSATATPIETVILHHQTNITSSLQLTPSVTPGAAIPCTGTGTAKTCTAMLTLKNTSSSTISGSINTVLDGMIYLQGLNIPAASTTGAPAAQGSYGALSNQYSTASPKLASPIATNTGLYTDVTLTDAVSSNNGEPMMKANTKSLKAGVSTIIPLVFQNPNNETLTFCTSGQVPHWTSAGGAVKCINPIVYLQ
jgi:predicted phosphodiesterase